MVPLLMTPPPGPPPPPPAHPTSSLQDQKKNRALQHQTDLSVKQVITSLPVREGKERVHVAVGVGVQTLLASP
jgi:hypothetical protein